MPRPFYDLRGQKFQMLTVIDQAPSRRNNKTRWNCLCDCGKMADIPADALKSGKQKSCGCLNVKYKKDLTGEVFGSLTVIEPAGKIKNRPSFLCHCECGRTDFVVTHNALTRGNTKSCGCYSYMKVDDLIGQQFGRLKVIERHLEEGVRDRNTYAKWLCECECGELFIAQGRHMQSGAIKSCGCSQKGKRNSRYTGIGEMPGAAWYNIVKGAKSRAKIIPVYITKEEVYEIFVKQKGECALTGIPLKFSYSNGVALPDNNASLDRIDSSKPYEAGNCQWVDKNINMMKQSLSQEEFINFCRAVAKHHDMKEVA